MDITPQEQAALADSKIGDTVAFENHGYAWVVTDVAHGYARLWCPALGSDNFVSFT